MPISFTTNWRYATLSRSNFSPVWILPLIPTDVSDINSLMLAQDGISDVGGQAVERGTKAPCGARFTSHMITRAIFLMGLAAMLLISIADAQAKVVNLAWNASSGATSYGVYYGPSSGNHTTVALTDASGNPITGTTYTTPDLSAGTYYFTVKAFDSAGNSSGYSNEVSTTITAAPTVAFSASPTSGVAPLTVNFTDSSTNATAWSWNFGDSTTSTQQNPSHIYAVAGTYTVSLTATGPGGTTTTSKSNLISVASSTSTAPVASFNVSPGTTGDAPFTVTLTDTSTGNTSRTWNFGDGSNPTTVGTAQTFVKTYNTTTLSTSYTVTLTVSGSNKPPATSTITANAKSPVANFSAAPSASNPLVWNFTDSSKYTVTGWSWDFGDGSPADTAKNPVTYAKSGAYTVNLTASGPAGSNTKSSTVTVTGSGALPSPWQSADIGSIGLTGDASYANGTFTLNGSGADIWGRVDAFRFAYQSLNGDGTITARIRSLGNTNSWAKAGVMIRESLDANARHATVAITPTNGLVFQRRTWTGGRSYYTSGAAAATPYWVRLTRAGDTFTAYQSADGSQWVQIGYSTISMVSNVYVGLVVTSHDNSTLDTATLNNASVTK